MIEIDKICKKYGEKIIYDNFSVRFDSGADYLLTGESGAGKTTLLRIIAGLEKPDSGRIDCPYKISFMFQENRLLENRTAVENIEICSGIPKENARKELQKLLPDDSLNIPARDLSVGMKRRVALVRAMLFQGDVVILDEPFASLDEENIDRVTNYILEHKTGRTLIVASHIVRTLDFCKNIEVGRT